MNPIQQNSSTLHYGICGIVNSFYEGVGFSVTLHYGIAWHTSYHGSAGFHSMDVKFGSAPFLQIMDRNKAGIVLA